MTAQQMVQPRQLPVQGMTSTPGGSPHIPLPSPQIPINSQAPLPSPRLTSVQQQMSPRPVTVANTNPGSPRPGLVPSIMNHAQNGNVVFSQTVSLPSAAANVAALPQQPAGQPVPTTSVAPGPIPSPRFAPQQTMATIPPVTAEVSQVHAAPSTSVAPTATLTSNGNATPTSNGNLP